MSKVTIEQLQVQYIPNNSELENRLFEIFQQTVKEELTISSIRNRYQDVYQSDIFFLTKNGKDIGFAMITYYKTTHEGKDIFLARPAMGIRNSARGNKFPMDKYIAAFLRFKFKHPRQQVILFTCPVNPIPYSASSKYWVDSYPKYNKAYPNDMKAIKETALRFFGMTEIRDNVIQLPFGPLLDQKDIHRFYA